MRPFLLRTGRITAYLGLTLPLMAVQTALLAARSKFRVELPVAYHKLCCRILGFDVATRGQISERRPTLFVSNHVSYVDIEVLGGLVPGSFIAKDEVARWPLFGQLAKLQRTVFVDRRVRSTAAQRDDIGARLSAGDNLILFPEGTSGDGNRVLPFKSALFSVAGLNPGGEPLAVQPVSIAYARLDGMPLGRAWRPHVAWYGDMEMLPHLWELLGLGVIGVVVEFHPVVTLAEFGSRKNLAEHCWRTISTGVAGALSGRRDIATAGA
jgi:1-acyl-sn-glycerol-3-phosphate acyltransferase